MAGVSTQHRYHYPQYIHFPPEIYNGMAKNENIISEAIKKWVFFTKAKMASISGIFDKCQDHKVY